MSSSSSSAPIINPLVGQAISEKLIKTNHALWKPQILAVVRGARLAIKPPTPLVKEKQGDKEVEVRNPAYVEWAAIDQQVLGCLLSSMTSSILSQVTACKTVAETWSIIEGMFTSMIRARSINTRIALATMKKGEFSMAEYVGKMRSLADEMAHPGKTIDDDKLISYILSDLDYNYNFIVSALVARVEPLSVGEVYSQLLAFEQRKDLLHGDSHSSVNAASRGRGGQRGCGGGRCSCSSSKNRG